MTETVDCPVCGAGRQAEVKRVTDNQQRAAEVLGFRELEDAKRYARDDLDRVATALDAAEARGAAQALKDAAHYLDDGDEQAIAVAFGGAPYVHRVLCDRAAALRAEESA